MTMHLRYPPRVTPTSMGEDAVFISEEERYRMNANSGGVKHMFDLEMLGNLM